MRIKSKGMLTLLYARSFMISLLAVSFFLGVAMVLYGVFSEEALFEKSYGGAGEQAFMAVFFSLAAV